MKVDPKRVEVVLARLSLARFGDRDRQRAQLERSAVAQSGDDPLAVRILKRAIEQLPRWRSCEDPLQRTRRAYWLDRAVTQSGSPKGRTFCPHSECQPSRAPLRARRLPMLFYNRPTHARAFSFRPDPFAVFERFERQQEETQRAPYAELTAREDVDKVVLTAELPGVSPTQLDVTIKDRTLRISAKTEADAPQGYETRRKERSSYSFSRELTLGEKVDVASITAVLS